MKAEPDLAVDMNAGRAGLGAVVRAYGEVAVMVAASTLAGLAVAPRWGTGPVDLLYLPPVLAAASRSGLRPALIAAAASALAYNYFFTTPVHSLRVDRPADLVTVLILFVVALVTSQLAARMRGQARLARAAAARNATIAGLAGRLLSAATEQEVGEVACAEIAAVFGCNAVLVVGRDGVVETLARHPGAGMLTPSDVAAAAVTLATGEPAGRGASRLDPAEWLFRPIPADAAPLAALGLARNDGGEAVPREQLALLDNLIDQVAMALERVHLERSAREVEALRERDRLRHALLSSVGHDLRTPLTAIVAAAAELRRGGDRPGLTAIVASEAAKLERYIANLLDMARIEAGTIRLRREPIDLVDAVTAAVEDVGGHEAPGAIEIDIATDLPLVRADAKLLHHVLINLIDNGRRHGGGRIRIGAARRDGAIDLSVADSGPGLGGRGDRMFDTFARIGGSDRIGGAGLGLAIVRAFAEAMGATIRAEDRVGGGAVFTLEFPATLTVDEVQLGEALQDPGR